MTIKVNLPKSGMGIEEGTVVRWLKSVGDSVVRGDLLAEVETAKAVQEIEAPASGVLLRILVGAGETVPVNSALAEIESA